MANKVATISLSLIRPNPVALRGVDKTKPEYVQLVDSIQKNGIINAISVREIANPDQPAITLYGLIDGLHRFTAAGDAGLTEINATILPLDDAEVEEAQIIANIHKIETKPVEYSKALQRLMARNPTMTVSELSDRLSRSPAWLGERLNLTKLIPTVADVVNEGKIGLSNGYALSKLPVEEQAAWVDRAMTLPPSEFVPQVNTRVKEIRDAKKQGRDPNATFTPVAFMQKMSAINEELVSGNYAQKLVHHAKTPHDAFKLALQWVQHLDPVSKQEQTEKHEARMKAQADAKEARQKEREEKKNAEATKVAVEAGA